MTRCFSLWPQRSHDSPVIPCFQLQFTKRFDLYNKADKRGTRAYTTRKTKKPSCLAGYQIRDRSPIKIVVHRSRHNRLIVICVTRVSDHLRVCKQRTTTTGFLWTDVLIAAISTTFTKSLLGRAKPISLYHESTYWSITLITTFLHRILADIRIFRVIITRNRRWHVVFQNNCVITKCISARALYEPST